MAAAATSKTEQEEMNEMQRQTQHHGHKRHHRDSAGAENAATARKKKYSLRSRDHQYRYRDGKTNVVVDASTSGMTTSYPEQNSQIYVTSGGVGSPSPKHYHKRYTYGRRYRHELAAFVSVPDALGHQRSFVSSSSQLAKAVITGIPTLSTILEEGENR
eukprot:7370156-Ditylum_brightwellii.AAC.1